MTTTVDLSERTTEIPTEIDFTTFETEIPTEIDFTTSVTGEDYNTEESTETNNNKFKNEDKIPSRLRGHPDLIDMYAINRCLGLLDELFCLNGGKCFNYTMRNAPAVFFLSCECAEGFMDERCDFKYLEGTHKRK